MDITFIGNPFGGIGTNDTCDGFFATCPSHSCDAVDCGVLKCPSHHCSNKDYTSTTGILDDSDDD